jgi:hypothetical protein
MASQVAATAIPVEEDEEDDQRLAAASRYVDDHRLAAGVDASLEQR